MMKFIFIALIACSQAGLLERAFERLENELSDGRRDSEGRHEFDHVGVGYCRPANCELTSKSCRVSGSIKDGLGDESSCKRKCQELIACSGYTWEPVGTYLSRCIVYGMLGSVSGWQTSTKDYTVIARSSGQSAPFANCYTKSVSHANEPTISYVYGKPDEFACTNGGSVIRGGKDCRTALKALNIGYREERVKDNGSYCFKDRHGKGQNDPRYFGYYGSKVICLSKTYIDFGYECKYGEGASGKSISSLETKTKRDCQAACNKNAMCVGYDFKSKRCRLYPKGDYPRFGTTDGSVYCYIKSDCVCPHGKMIDGCWFGQDGCSSCKDGYVLAKNLCIKYEEGLPYTGKCGSLANAKLIDYTEEGVYNWQCKIGYIDYYGTCPEHGVSLKCKNKYDSSGKIIRNKYSWQPQYGEGEGWGDNMFCEEININVNEKDYRACYSNCQCQNREVCTYLKPSINGGESKVGICETV